ncbi:hypothetical protein B0H67DRAFT_610605, partial [Lasiosphaeris hirsuta]
MRSNVQRKTRRSQSSRGRQHLPTFPTRETDTSSTAQIGLDKIPLNSVKLTLHKTMGEALRSGSVESIADTLEKPLLDNRSYRVMRLPNQLEIVLVYDPDTDKAAATMDVNVESFSDPDDLPGTAHELEHFCFVGTEKPVCAIVFPKA